jgi:hypothetical protein
MSDGMTELKEEIQRTVKEIKTDLPHEDDYAGNLDRLNSLGWLEALEWVLLRLDAHEGEQGLLRKFKEIFSDTRYDNNHGQHIFSSDTEAMYVDWDWWDEPCDEVLALFKEEIMPVLIRDNEFDLMIQAVQAIQEYEKRNKGVEA